MESVTSAPMQNTESAKAKIINILSMPDGELSWCLRVKKAIKRSNLGDWADIVLTTSPPESIHGLGRWMKKKYGIVWIADVRDFWLLHPLQPIRKKPWRRMFEKRIARYYLNSTNAIISPSSKILDEMKSLISGNALTEVIEQPAPYLGQSKDQETFLGRRKQSPAGPRILHSGSFTQSDPSRTITPLLDLIKEARKKNPEIQLELSGRITAAELDEAQKCLGQNVSYYGVETLEESWSRISSANMLALVVAPGSSSVPGKLAEYRMSGLPIVYIGEGPWKKVIGLKNLPPPAVQLHHLLNNSHKHEVLFNSSYPTINAIAIKLEVLMKRCTEQPDFKKSNSF